MLNPPLGRKKPFLILNKSVDIFTTYKGNRDDRPCVDLVIQGKAHGRFMSFLLYLVYDGIGTKEAGNLETSESHDLPKNTKLTNKTKSCSPLPNNQGQDNPDKSYFA